MRRGLGIAVVLGALRAPIGWLTTDQLESNNEFCVACHLDDQTPLHEAKMNELMASPPVNLASLHFVGEEL